MASETGGRDYSLTELFALKFVLADVVIIMVLLLGGPLYAVAVTALFVLSFVLLWYLTRPSDEDAEDETERTTRTTMERGRERGTGAHASTGTDPVTELQERYAAGELSDAEFESKLDRLIESNERAERAGIDIDDLELEYERSN